jgi:hypothetical protein
MLAGNPTDLEIVRVQIDNQHLSCNLSTAFLRIVSTIERLYALRSGSADRNNPDAKNSKSLALESVPTGPLLLLFLFLYLIFHPVHQVL